MRLMKPVTQPALKEFDRFFDRFFQNQAWPLMPARAMPDPLWEPALDLSETPKEYLVRMEVPGMTRDDLDVSLDGNLLTLSGRRELHKNDKGEDYLWEERIEGRFTRTLRLPGAVDEAKIDAGYDHGILTVTLPKKEPAEKSRITIR